MEARMKRIAAFVLICLAASAAPFTVHAQTEKEEGRRQLGLFHIIRNGKYGYIDSKGKIVIQPQFDEADEFSEGLAPIRIGDKWGYIDPTGRIVIKPQYGRVGEFSEGLAGVSVAGGKEGYMDRAQRIVIQPQFDKTWPFVGGLARVKIGDKMGYIDKKGNYVWKPTD
jgi:hypothetical protein